MSCFFGSFRGKSVHCDMNYLEQCFFSTASIDYWWTMVINVYRLLNYKSNSTWFIKLNIVKRLKGQLSQLLINIYRDHLHELSLQYICNSIFLLVRHFVFNFRVSDGFTFYLQKNFECPWCPLIFYSQITQFYIDLIYVLDFCFPISQFSNFPISKFPNWSACNRYFYYTISYVK